MFLCLNSMKDIHSKVFFLKPYFIGSVVTDCLLNILFYFFNMTFFLLFLSFIIIDKTLNFKLYFVSSVVTNCLLNIFFFFFFCLTSTKDIP